MIRNPQTLLRIAAAMCALGLSLFAAASLVSPPESVHVTLAPGVFYPLGPVQVRLDGFRICSGKDGEVTDYVSELTLMGESGLRGAAVRVGHPLRIAQTRLYQADWKELPDGMRASVLECVRDPLVPVKEAGCWIMIAAALLTIAGAACGGGRPGAGWVPALCAALVAVFTWIVLDSVGVGSRSLPPVLRSGWFPVHLASYMCAYAVLAAATLLSFLGRRHDALLLTLMRVGWALLTCGMTLGALWAQRSWGTFWSWDPKETWALVTFLSYLLCLHLPSSRPALRTVFLVVSFLLLQMCWWGAGVLFPDAGSMHLYSR